MELPVYLINGFLDSGKTSFINGILEDGFAHDDPALLLCCEEGEEAYSKQALFNITPIVVENLESLTPAFLADLEKTYHPKQVIIEWNGMWSMDSLCKTLLPDNWLIYQIMIFVDATTFEVYTRNMGQLMMEKIINADLLVFNRCDDDLKATLRTRNLRMVNRRADIFLESEDGESEDYINSDTPPFDMDVPVLQISDEEFGLFYVDVMDFPQRYVGKELELNLVMSHSKKFPNTFVPGRFAMVCCEDDIEFLGLLGKGDCLASFADYQWMHVTATVSMIEHEAYEGEGPMLQVHTAVPTEKPEDDIVNF